MMNKVLATLMLAITPITRAATFDLPPGEFDLFGYDREAAATYQDTLIDIARRNGIGQEEILRANPDVDRWLPGEGTRVTIPSRYIIPDAPRSGLILNLPEMRLYYFPKTRAGETPTVQTYPVGIGRMEWRTPLGKTTVIAKQKNPAWYPPESIRREHAAQGDPLPKVVPPGPDNPLGAYAIRLGIPGYLIHSTNKGDGVGMRVSHGCVRMAPEDIEVFFPQIPTGTPVHIINQPVKAGWYGGQLYLEVHPPLDEEAQDMGELVVATMDALEQALDKREVALDNDAINAELIRRSGMPIAISKGY